MESYKQIKRGLPQMDKRFFFPLFGTNSGHDPERGERERERERKSPFKVLNLRDAMYILVLAAVRTE